MGHDALLQLWRNPHIHHLRASDGVLLKGEGQQVVAGMEML